MTNNDRAPLIAFIGEPNVGKSTLLKRITGLRKIVVANEPHTTRDLNFGEDYWSGYLLRFVDTGGIVPDPSDKIQKEVQIKSWSAIADADLLVWVMSVKRDPDTVTTKMLHRLWKTGKPFIVAINKVDDPNQDADLADYAQFGGVGFVNMSARNGYGINDLLDAIVEWAEQTGFTKPETLTEKLPSKEYLRKESQTVKKDPEGGYYIVRDNTPEGPGLYSSIDERDQYTQIENIVLDLGNVVIRESHEAIGDYLLDTYPESGLNYDRFKTVWKEKFTTYFNQDPEGIFLSKLSFWKDLLTTLGLETKSASKIKKIFFEHRELIDSTVEFIYNQKAQGKRFYFLSNVIAELFDFPEYEIAEEFEGGIASHWVGVNKPNPEIYKILTNKYQIDPKKTVFVDDRQDNVITAVKMGMKGVVFDPQNTNLEEEIERIQNTPTPKKPIKNLVFDFYGVLFTQGDKTFREFLENKIGPLTRDQNNNLNNWFGELFLEKIRVRDLSQKIAENFDLKMSAEEIQEIWETGSTEIEAVYEFLTTQKLAGKNIYYLTNVGQSAFEKRQQSSIFKYFDGGVASCEVGIRKPDPAIYQELIKKYNLDPEDTVFIDDKLENVETARQLGLWGIQYLEKETNLDLELNRIEHGLKSRVPKIPKILLLGKPNVGKSSIFNGLIKKDLQIVTEIAGTTLSVNDYLIEKPKTGKKFILLDSTGIRKAGQRTMGAETFATYKTIEAANEADVLCLITDGSQPLTHQDQVVAGICKEAKKGLVVIANKADLIGPEEQAKFQKDFRFRFQFLKIDKFIWVSATNPQTGKGKDKNLLGDTRLDQIWTAVDEALENRSKVIEHHELRTLFNYLMKQKPPKKLSLKKRPVIYDLLYTSSEPPTFELLIKDPETVHWSYVRFLENLIRKQFNFAATGIVVKLTKVNRKKVMT